MLLTLMRLRDGASGFARVRGQLRPAIGRPGLAWAALVVMLLGIAGCATTGPVARSYWREDLGNMNVATIDDALGKIVPKHSLRVVNRLVGRGGDARWELNWISREVVAEEELRGVTAARNRILITGVQSATGATDNYRMRWELANEVTTQTNPDWHPDVVPASVIEEFRRVYADLTLEVRTGVRR